MLIHLLCLSFVVSPVFCNKYSKEKNSLDYEKLMALDKPFRMQKLNLVWEKATKKIPSEKLKQLYTDLKFQDKEEVTWKAEKAKGLDKNEMKEALLQGSFKAILEKYHLWQDYVALQESVLSEQRASPEGGHYYDKALFRDKKLNKLWLKAEQQGFSKEELMTLKEEFQHHQDKIDQYYQILNQLHKKDSEDNEMNAILHAEEGGGEKVWKADNPHQVLKEKHAHLKAGYEYLNGRIVESGRMEFEEPQVNSLWLMAKNASFTPEELDSLRSELHHFEHRVKKLKVLSSASDSEDANVVDEVVMKREKKLKEYSHKVDKIHKELSSRILQRHSEL